MTTRHEEPTVSIFIAQSLKATPLNGCDFCVSYDVPSSGAALFLILGRLWRYEKKENRGVPSNMCFKKRKRAYTLGGETTCPSANIPATQHQREGSGISFNRKGPRASSKECTFPVRTCSRGYDEMLLLGHAMRPHLCVLSAQSCTLSRPASHRACRKSPFGNCRYVGRAIANDDKTLLIF